MLTVYKASAGSGKTFQLVVEYLKLLLKNPQNYRHILAVTFTNKATGEMKTRILETLNQLAGGHPSKYIAEIQKENGLTEDQIRSNAKVVLKNILHDYNRFSVNTIDSFTQRTIKAFNRELGISPNYKLELNSEMILSEATDRLLSKIGNDKKLLKWLKNFSREKIESSRSQRIEDDIKALGKELFKEKFQSFYQENDNTGYKRKNLLRFGTDLRKIKDQFENELKALAKKGIAIIVGEELTVDDFSYKSGGVAGYFYKIEKEGYAEPGSRVLEAAESAEKWYGKTSPKKAQIHALAETRLRPLLNQILDFISTNEEQYFSALAVLKQLRMLGILTDLKEEIKSLLHEKGVLQLSDANLLLSKIIDKSDSPFIYEKTGSTYHHFMIDEFQDTSDLQWENFKPLILNSLAGGNVNLLVGDVKQSIYRWRNSDYKILAERIYKDFTAEQLSEHTLEKNWRSDKNIIEFNNHIFENLKVIFRDIFSKITGENNHSYIERFQKIYESVAQVPGKNETVQNGFLKISFLEEDNFNLNSAESMVEEVKKLLDNGLSASEIAIQTRTNKEGTAVIETFLAASRLPENEKYNLSVLSNESLFLCSSQGVLMIIDTIDFVINPEKEITKISLLNHWVNWLKPELARLGKEMETEPFNFNEKYNDIFTNELLPKIEHLKKKVLLTSLDEAIFQICSVFQLFEIESELPFIQTLIDKAGELKSTLSNDLSNFLFWWSENGQTTSVNVNEDIDSIRLLTVHKSKGLEFKAVLIPYFNWKLNQTGNFAPVLWCEPDSEPFNRFPLLPVKYDKTLKQSIFKTDFFEETTNQLIDNFNLAYVAFTRAVSVLIINCPQPKEATTANNDSVKPFHFYFKAALDGLSDIGLFKNCWNEEKSVFQFGSIQTNKTENQKPKPEIIKKYQFHDFSDRLKLRNSGEDFLVTGTSQGSVKNKGKIIHEILSSVRNFSEIEKAFLKASYEGRIDEKEMVEMQNSLKINFENPVTQKWFSGKYRVLNERNLLTPEVILRPDRIMVSEKNAIVVDYKTGEKKSEKYNLQVIRYAKTLKATGFEKVEGFLWYINQNEIEKVCEY